MRAAALLSALVLVAGCGEKTFIELDLAAGPAMPQAVQRIDLDLDLAGRRASARLGGDRPILFPTTAVLVIGSGSGELVIHALAVDAGEQVVAEAWATANVVRGQTGRAALAFGEDRRGDAGTDAAGDGGDPRCAVCDRQATCDTSSGQAVCTCQPGFSGDGKSCTDIDECATGAAGCDTNATCANKPGSFSCTCNPNYKGDGKTCTQVWSLLHEIPDIDTLYYGHVAGSAAKIYLGNDTSTAGARYFKGVAVNMSPVTVTDEMQMAAGNSQWCWCGGCSGSSLFTAVGVHRWLVGCGLHAFDTVAGAWTDVTASYNTSMKQRTGAAVGAHASMLYVVGGKDYSPTNLGILKSVMTIDVSTPAMPAFPATPVPDYPIFIQNAGSFTIGGKLHVFGGETKVGSQIQPTPKMHVIDLTVGPLTWTPLPDLPFTWRMSYLAPYTAVYKGKGYVFDSADRMQVFDPATNTWSASPVAGPPMGATQGRGWMPVVAGATPALYVVNHVDAGGTVKVVIYKYLLE